MTIDSNDPRLTAYVLGGLSPRQYAAVEKALRNSPDAQQVVEDIRQMANRLSDEVHRQPMVGLSADRREAILSRISEMEPSQALSGGGFAVPRRLLWITSGLAACLVIAITAIRLTTLQSWQAPPDLIASSQSNSPQHSILRPPLELSADPLPKTSIRAKVYPPVSDRNQSDSDPAAQEVINVEIVGSLSGDASDGLALFGINMTNTGAKKWSDAYSPPSASGSVRPLVFPKLGMEQHVSDEVDIDGAWELDDAVPATEYAKDDGWAPMIVAIEDADHVAIADANANDISDNCDADAPSRGGRTRVSQKGSLLIMPDELPEAHGGREVRVPAILVPKAVAPPTPPRAVVSAQQRPTSKPARTMLVTNSTRASTRTEPPRVVFRSKPQGNNEAYDSIQESTFCDPLQQPLSTFSVDVDTASYSNARRFLREGHLPPPNAVRIEELINYFRYDYPQPQGEAPFSVNVEVAECPWDGYHRLARIGLKGYNVTREERPPSNLVFLLDVSGSMEPANKLPLLQQSMRLLVQRLDELDRVAIVVYSDAARVVLDSTNCDEKHRLLAAINGLMASGSTNGASGIELAYQVATASFIEGGTNRVILATDGDFNVGITERADLMRLIEEQAETGVFLSVLGFGTGNLKDGSLESLADQGNGVYAYIDSLGEAHKTLVEQMGGTLVTIAKDVKIQVEFNPAEVTAYRLIGYENRKLAGRDFIDDTKDAGEIGAGHTVTALYEIVPAGTELDLPGVDPLKYQVTESPRTLTGSDELMTVKLRYKLPDEDTSKLLEYAIKDDGRLLEEASADFRFAVAVASFGMLLRDSEYKGDATYDSVLALAETGLGDDPNSRRIEFLELITQAAELADP